jgi:hypothetical protein
MDAHVSALLLALPRWQVRMLAAARLRHLEGARKQAADEAAWREQAQQAAAAAAEAAKQQEEALLQAAADASAQEASTVSTQLQAEQRTQAGQQEALAAAHVQALDMQAQIEWLEAAVADLQSGSSRSGAFAQLQAEVKRLREECEGRRGALAQRDAAENSLREAQQQLQVLSVERDQLQQALQEQQEQQLLLEQHVQQLEMQAPTSSSAAPHTQPPEPELQEGSQSMKARALQGAGRKPASLEVPPGCVAGGAMQDWVRTEPSWAAHAARLQAMICQLQQQLHEEQKRCSLLRKHVRERGGLRASWAHALDLSDDEQEGGEWQQEQQLPADEGAKGGLQPGEAQGCKRGVDSGAQTEEDALKRLGEKC